MLWSGVGDRRLKYVLEKQIPSELPGPFLGFLAVVATLNWLVALRLRNRMLEMFEKKRW